MCYAIQKLGGKIGISMNNFKFTLDLFHLV